MIRSNLTQSTSGLGAAVALAAAALALSRPAQAQAPTNCPSTGLPPIGGAELCNTGAVNPDTWVYGPRVNLTPAQQTAPFWNPVKTRIAAGLPIVGRRVSAAAASAPGGYCSVAQYNQTDNHFTWVDLRHTGLKVTQLWALWLNNACPGLNYSTTAVRGVQALSIDERENQHASDGGAMVFIVPVNSGADALEAVFWTVNPPNGHHSQGSGQMGTVNSGTGPEAYPGAATISVAAAGGWRNSFNRNAVVIAQIGSVEGARQAAAIASVDRIDAIFLDEADLASRSGRSADFEELANAVKVAARDHDKHLCTVDRSVTPNVMTCLQQ